jgi:hypothetical protein
MIPLPKPRGFWDYALFAFVMAGALVFLFWLEASDGVGWADAAFAFAGAVLFVFATIIRDEIRTKSGRTKSGTDGSDPICFVPTRVGVSSVCPRISPCQLGAGVTDATGNINRLLDYKYHVTPQNQGSRLYPAFVPPPPAATVPH